MIKKIFALSVTAKEILVDFLCEDNEYILSFQVWNYNNDDNKVTVDIGETQEVTVAGTAYNVVSELNTQINISEAGLNASLILGCIVTIDSNTGLQTEDNIVVVNTRSSYVVSPKKVLEIYQGESCAWQGYLIDDDGTIISDISTYDVDIALKSDKNKIILKWDINDIILGNDGHFVITLPSTKTKRLAMGLYKMECAISRGDDTSAIAEKQSVLSVKSSALKSSEL